MWAVCTGVGLGTVFPICLTMCLDIARVPAEAGAAAALMFLVGYPIAALGPLGAGAVRDLSGSFDASLWGLFAITLVMAVALVPLTTAAAAARGRLMDRGVAVALATVIGGTLALQAPLNSLLGRSVGGLTASVVAFAVGLAALLAVSVLAGGLGGIAQIGRRAVVGDRRRRADQRALRRLDRLDGARARRGRADGGDDRGPVRGRDGRRPLRLARRRAIADHRRQAGRARAARGGHVARRAGLTPSTMRKLHVEWRNMRR